MAATCWDTTVTGGGHSRGPRRSTRRPRVGPEHCADGTRDAGASSQAGGGVGQGVGKGSIERRDMRAVNFNLQCVPDRPRPRVPAISKSVRSYAFAKNTMTYTCSMSGYGEVGLSQLHSISLLASRTSKHKPRPTHIAAFRHALKPISIGRWSIHT